MTTTVLFVLLGIFIMRVVPTWIKFEYDWLNTVLKTLCYVVGLFFVVYFICSIIYNTPQIFNVLLY